jgi:fatty-acid desaturase
MRPPVFRVESNNADATAGFAFERPPPFTVEPEVSEDPWYRWLERMWMLQQVPIAAALFAVGGWTWVVWGVFVRVSVSVSGHWVVNYLTHKPGPRARCRALLSAL